MSTLIGRAAEEAALIDLLARAKTGHGGLAVISGEPGIGKSALAQSIAAEAKGFTVTHGKAWEFADAPPYFPLWPCLRSLGLEAGAGGFALWEKVVEALARSAPALWVLEDLHAADQQTLELVSYLAQPLRALKAAVIVTTRAQDPRITPRAEQLLSRLQRDGVSLPLQPLSAGDVSLLARQVAGNQVPLQKLLDLSAGNPLFVIECARTLRESRTAVLPSTVRQLVLDQSSLLPEETRERLEAGAVLGRDFSAALVARMGAALPARVIDDLAAALRGGLILEARPGHFRFSHALVRDAIYSAITATRRQSLHAEAEAALAMLGDSTENLVERTHHALEAGTPEAASLADRAIALEAAQGAFDRAYALARRVREMARRDDGDSLLALARLAQSSGAWNDSRKLCEEAIGRARAAGDGEGFARAALLFGAELRPAIVDPVLVRWLEEALQRVPEGPLAIRLRARLAAALQPAADPLVPIEMARRAIREAEAAGDDALLLEVLFFCGSALTDFAPLAECVACAERLLEHALLLGDRERALHACFRLALDVLQLGDFARFELLIEEMAEHALLLGHPRHQWRVLLFRSMRAIMYGDFAASERFLVEVDQMASLIDTPALALALNSHRMHRARLLRDQESVLACAERFHEMTRSMPYADLFRVANLASMEAWFDLPRTPVRLDSHVLLADNTGWVLGAEAVAAAGTVEQIREFLAVAQKAPPECVSGHIQHSYEGPTPRMLGLLHEALGELAAAEENLRKALEHTKERGLVPWEARIRQELGRVLARAGRSDPSLTAEAAPAPVGTKRIAMQREGEVWAVEFDGRTLRVKDTRGLQLLERLILRPDEELHVLALANDEGAALADSDAGEVLDLAAAKQYRRRLREIEDEIEEADPGRAARLSAEREWLSAELARGLDLSGDPRRAGSASERARVNVQRRIKDAIKRLGEAYAPLGSYLARAVRTGTYCCYRP